MAGDQLTPPSYVSRMVGVASSCTGKVRMKLACEAGLAMGSDEVVEEAVPRAAPIGDAPTAMPSDLLGNITDIIPLGLITPA